MLVRFKFSNFKCFRDEAVLSMVASKYKSDDKVGNTFKTDYYSLLKSAAVYGANASGKTNSRTVGRRSMLLLNCQRCQQKSQAYLRLSSFWRGCNIDMALSLMETR